MLFKRGSTISAAEGGCQAEVGGVLHLLRVVHWASLTLRFTSCMFDGERRIRRVYGRYVHGFVTLGTMVGTSSHAGP